MVCSVQKLIDVYKFVFLLLLLIDDDDEWLFCVWCVVC